VFPILHFFDGFRTSHEINKFEQLALEDMRAMIDDSPDYMKDSMSQCYVAEPSAFERANYLKALNSFDRSLP